MNSINYLEAFQRSYANMVQDEDLMKPFQAAAPRDNNCFPTRPLIEVSSLANADIETLVLILTHQSDPYERFIAAQLMRQRCWRFNKKYMMWFRRARDPTQMTADFEAGEYLMFDTVEHFRIKQIPAFKFEYKFSD